LLLLDGDHAAHAVDTGQRPAPERVRDVEQMAAHRVLGRLGLARDDRLDDRGVLRLRCRRASWNQDRAVLVAHRLGVQPVDQALGRAVPGQLEQCGMQVGVRIRGAEQVTRLEERTMPRQNRLQPLCAGIVDPLGGQPHREALEHRACLEDLDRLGVGDLAHAGTPVRLAHDEPFLLEPYQRVPDGGPGHLERRDDVRLDKTGVGRDLAPHDGGAQLLVVRVGVGVGCRRAHRGFPA
jgi:hypothetical protein